MPATSTKLRYPPADQTAPPPLFGVLVLAALVIVCVGLKNISSIVGPLFLVLTLVITVYPLRARLVARKVPQVLASIAALFAVYALLIIVLGSVAWSLARLVTALTDYSTEFNALYQQSLGLLGRFGVSQGAVQDAASGLNLSSFAGVAQSLLNGLTSGLSLLALMAALVFFLVFDAAGIEDRIALIRMERPQVADALTEFAHSVRLYWVVTTVFGLLVAILNVIGLLIIGVPLALTWGVLAFVTNYIPNIGFLIGLVPPTLIALLEGGWGDALAVIIVYTALNVIVQTLVQPRFTGDAVGITGTVAFVSLIFWAYLLGALGALLAVPATLLVKALLIDNSNAGRWLGALINNAPKGASKARPGIGVTGEQTDSPPLAPAENVNPT
ncbi:MAG TPA: AI-2E family transporter [Propionibacteriaceae bacterium]|nr:AI-2E family transporter [Propionibacteriaceae bacterium]